RGPQRSGTGPQRRGTGPQRTGSGTHVACQTPLLHLEAVAAQEASCDDQLLDLVRALSYEEEGVVAVEALDLELLRVAVAAVDAHRLLDAALGDLRREELRHAGFHVRPAAGVLLAR